MISEDLGFVNVENGVLKLLIFYDKNCNCHWIRLADRKFHFAFSQYFSPRTYLNVQSPVQNIYHVLYHQETLQFVAQCVYVFRNILFTNTASYQKFISLLDVLWIQ
jgi:hypothetical protein